MTQKRIRSKAPRTLEMEIDHRTVSFPEGIHVLRAAELNDIYIPSLCSHKDLSPFGGCRMCVVEIEGMRGYPLACSTFAQEGMKVLTDTATLRQMREEILQLILSEHPSSCLVCDERTNCRGHQYTIRKTGVSTGCRYCSNDGQCELQDVAEKIGLKEIKYPVYYRGYEAEHDDPFFDRDYNICILCGRCVRMCHEVRGTSILAFKYRGPRVQIGPAFGKSHVDAGCEFCGACVSVCPTGALADKSSKWDGKPDGIEVSTCPFCGIGCRIELHHKDGMLSKVYPNLDAEINDGQLCVRGRFSLPEATHYHQRAKKPMLRRGKYFREVTWPEVRREVAGRLKGLKPEDFLMVVSGDLTNEGLYAARRFVRDCMGCDSIDSTARKALTGGPALWSKLFSLPISIKGVAESDSIIALGLDSRFYFSVIGVQIRRALHKGASLVTIDARDSNLARYTDDWLRPKPAKEALVLDAISRIMDREKCNLKEVTGNTGVSESSLKRAIANIEAGERLAIIIGPAVFGYGTNQVLLDTLLRLARRDNTIFMPLYNGANARGALELGIFRELLPEAAEAGTDGILLADMIEGRKRPKVLYLVGESPFFTRPDCDYVIAQDIYYPPFEIDAFLPAASFAEAEGTLTNIEGRVQELVRIEKTPDGKVSGFVRPDWHIFSELSRELGCETIRYESAGDVLKEIHAEVSGFPGNADRKPRQFNPPVARPLEPRDVSIPGKGKYVLIAQPAGFQHRGIDLAYAVEGLSELALEEGFRIHPGDMEKLGVKTGDPVTVSLNGLTTTAPVKADQECPAGAIYFYRPLNFGGLSHRRDLEPLYRNSETPVKVRVRPAVKEGERRPKKRTSTKSRKKANPQ